MAILVHILRASPRAGIGLRYYAPSLRQLGVVRMGSNVGQNRVLQMRLVVEAADYEQAVAFYRDVLGVSEQAAFEGEGGAKVTILDVGRATLEIANPAQVAMIDDVEVGRRVSPRLRVAFEVANAEEVTKDLMAGGATLIAAPTITTWRSLNSRLEAPADLQITIFEELDKGLDSSNG
jgi:catechol 2,3-dioxygenase-like lactoylglutathione lyase family enzyme